MKEKEADLKIESVTGFFSAITVAKTAFEFAAGLNPFLLSG